MTMPIAERRQIENEMIFRNANEKVGDDINELDIQLIKDDYPELASGKDIILHFICECSDENCAERIPLKLSFYQKIHKNRDAFIIKPNHQVKEIEKVIRTEKDYSVVEKNKSISEPTGGLNTTPTQNV
jgi:thermostable 8-oxoguanine DNA glycosylase